MVVPFDFAQGLRLCGESFDKLRIKSGHRPFDKLRACRIMRAILEISWPFPYARGMLQYEIGRATSTLRLLYRFLYEGLSTL